MSNFSFLEEKWPILAQLGENAEEYMYVDSNISIFKVGLFAEKLVNIMFELDDLTPLENENTHANRIKYLKNEGMLPQEIEELLFILRIHRNKAVHDGYESVNKAGMLVEAAFKLGAWFMETYGDYQFVTPPFIMPQEKIHSIDYSAMLKEKDEEIEHLMQQMTSNLSGITASKTERQKRARQAASKVQLDERQTRYLIDEQLRQVGWEADTQNLRYSKGTRPQKGRNIAIAEWPTESTIGDRGYADYALFVGTKLVGIVEAKRYHVDIPSVIDYQCRDYAKHIREEDKAYTINTWGEYKVPFLFATNGRKYLKQLEIKSGIWFLDTRIHSNIPRAQQGWMSPDGMMTLLEKDIESANEKLQHTTYDLLRDKDGLNLREYQIKAIEAAEQAIIKGQNKVLLSMATGTGKTRTLLGLIYRMIKSKRFNRVLFLVDRTALGEQAQDVFKEVKIEDLMTLDEIYNIKGLEEKDIDRETKIHVATVQSLVKRIMYNESESMPAVSDYDLIVIDEAHRGYILDKEMGEDELLYRNQDDFVSKYRTVIEYFDAVKVALTATPALHTTEIFGKPVFSYSYREAVIDGYLVDHDAPHIIKTKLSAEGINYQKGDIVPIYDPVTGEIMNSDALEDELRFEVDKFNKQVITENFNRVVLQEIANDINPDGEGKTLIFAVDDTHANLIVKILKEIYEDYGVDSEAVMKITGSVGGGNKKKVLEAIKRFKNEKYPNIVVTVDLLTTGVDVPEINTLVFMRRVKSRILYEQMLGRATRLCPAIGKTHFEIYDPVGVYESLQPFSTMKPVVASKSATFEDLINGLNIVDTEEKQKNQIDMIIAKLQRKNKKMSEKQLDRFKSLSKGETPKTFIEKIKKMEPQEAKKYIENTKKVFEIFNEGGTGSNRAVVISDKEDEIREHSRGYGTGVKPEDYLEEFKKFITENMNKIAALNIVCTRPKELTRDGLKELMLELDTHNFTEKQLNTAWQELKNEDIAADIISFIRQQALGSALISHEDRIKNAMNKLKKNHTFSKMQLDWLKRIENYLLNESILTKDTFDTGAFKSQGGFKRIDKIFKNQLTDIIEEVNEYLYEDRSIS